MKVKKKQIEVRKLQSNYTIGLICECKLCNNMFAESSKKQNKGKVVKYLPYKLKFDLLKHRTETNHNDYTLWLKMKKSEKLSIIPAKPAVFKIRGGDNLPLFPSFE